MSKANLFRESVMGTAPEGLFCKRIVSLVRGVRDLCAPSTFHMRYGLAISLYGKGEISRPSQGCHFNARHNPLFLCHTVCQYYWILFQLNVHQAGSSQSLTLFSSLGNGIGWNPDCEPENLALVVYVYGTKDQNEDSNIPTITSPIIQEVWTRPNYPHLPLRHPTSPSINPSLPPIIAKTESGGRSTVPRP